jgi:hypothetical protein
MRLTTRVLYADQVVISSIIIIPFLFSEYSTESLRIFTAYTRVLDVYITILLQMRGYTSSILDG